ncbi:hypothetical protein CHS0354_038788 [Potamilus streckersoni]|uniref:Uncharacterized protein n=1 Tax=Potamilus streckersoni TaxID=2493646 RepID=A0AAE0SS14_9BIVA|nr:hypothetical protein CHS0354_038788 [Potamilus streckersoni]
MIYFERRWLSIYNILLKSKTLPFDAYNLTENLDTLGISLEPARQKLGKEYKKNCEKPLHDIVQEKLQSLMLTGSLSIPVKITKIMTIPCIPSEDSTDDEIFSDDSNDTTDSGEFDGSEDH